MFDLRFWDDSMETLGLLGLWVRRDRLEVAAEFFPVRGQSVPVVIEPCPAPTRLLGEEPESPRHARAIENSTGLPDLSWRESQRTSPAA